MKKVLLNPDAATGSPPKETAQETIQRLTAEKAELKSRLEKFETVEAQRTADEKIIVEKMAQGLSRQQAINVIRRQRDFDAAQENKSKVRSPSSAAKAMADRLEDRKSKVQTQKTKAN